MQIDTRIIYDVSSGIGGRMYLCRLSRWFPDAAMTAAAVDRLVHHATIIEMNGESYRERSAARRAKGEETPISA